MCIYARGAGGPLGDPEQSRGRRHVKLAAALLMLLPTSAHAADAAPSRLYRLILLLRRDPEPANEQRGRLSKILNGARRFEPATYGIHGSALPFAICGPRARVERPSGVRRRAARQVKFQTIGRMGRRP